LLLRPVEHLQPRKLVGDAVGELPGSVRRVVVDHEDAVAVLQ
jgi:hypothetical protein